MLYSQPARCPCSSIFKRSHQVKHRACIPEFWILVFILILLTYCPLIYLLVWNKGGGVCLILLWFELERGWYCIPRVANPPRASEHRGH